MGRELSCVKCFGHWGCSSPGKFRWFCEFFVGVVGLRNIMFSKSALFFLHKALKLIMTLLTRPRTDRPLALFCFQFYSSGTWSSTEACECGALTFRHTMLNTKICFSRSPMCVLNAPDVLSFDGDLAETWGRLGQRVGNVAKTIEDRVTFPVDFNIDHKFDVSSQSKPAQVCIYCLHVTRQGGVD